MPGALRIASFNIKWATLSTLEAVAETLRGLHADVIALQEVDAGTHRTGRVDQAEQLGKLLGFDAHFAPARRHGSGRFGNAILTKLPVVDVRQHALRSRFSFESRVALDLRLRVGAKELHVVCTHFDFLPWSVRANARALVDHLSAHDAGVIVAGDFNAAPHHPALRAFLDRGYVDAHARHAAAPTFPAHRPLLRLDYVLADPRLAHTVRSASVHVDARSSDHLPVVADFDLDAAPSAVPEPV